jgi:CRISPR-associated protein Csm1
MSIQVFLQGNFSGIESFVLGSAAGGDRAVAGRCIWVSLLAEVLPRALLAELGLAKILLGTSGGKGFLVVIPQASLAAAEEFLTGAAADVSKMSGGRMRLTWGSTENLGDWSIVRKRLAEAVWKPLQVSPAAAEPGAFEPAAEFSREDMPSEYFDELMAGLRDAASVGWNPDAPARLVLGQGKHTWALGPSFDEIPLARHAAPGADGTGVGSPVELGNKAEGRAAWGVLRGEVDNFGARIKRAQSIEEHVQLSALFKQFFAGELTVACLQPEYWQKVTILHAGGDDFAAFGAWDALLDLAREIQRLFHRFVDANLQELAGPEGKTITMGLALAGGEQETLAELYDEAGRRLNAAKAGGRDCFHVFGRAAEWRHVNHARDLKEMMVRMTGELGCAPEFLAELSGFYREKPDTRTDRPWRYYRRIGRVLGAHKDREVQRLQKALITDIVGKNAAQVKLRPAGLVAVEWARMLQPRAADARG